MFSVLIRSGLSWLRNTVSAAVQAWQSFWFTPADPFLLGWIRILTGWMLTYNLAVWSLDLEAFFSADGLQPLAAVNELQTGRWIICFWKWVPDPWMWTTHWICLGGAILFMLGVATRVTSTLAFLITISYSQRVPVANFGLDQVLGMLCLYMAIGPSGAALSLDAWFRRKWLARHGLPPATAPVLRSSARVAMRLMQLHLCAVYFWAGFSKLKGPSWWTGEAMWRVLANAEYQTIDLTWMAWIPWLPFLIAHVTIAWEISFISLVWNPRLRPLMLTIGTLMHFGIGAFLGMWTFGLSMTFAYFSFADSGAWRKRTDQLAIAISNFVRQRRQNRARTISSEEKMAPDILDAAFENESLNAADIELFEPAIAETTVAGASVEPATTATPGQNERQPDRSRSLSLFGSADMTDDSTLSLVDHTDTHRVVAFAAQAKDRQQLRDYLAQHGMACRAFESASVAAHLWFPDVADAVIVLGQSQSAEQLLSMICDIQDQGPVPVLAVVSTHQAKALLQNLLSQPPLLIPYPVSMRQIRLAVESLFKEGATENWNRFSSDH